MRTSTEVVPVSQGFSPIRSQYSLVDERQVQPIQQRTYQAWMTDTSQEPFISTSTIIETKSGSFKKYVTTKCIMSLLIGFIICGIPLAVMSALYAQKKTSSSSSSDSSSSSVSLPSQCTSYIANSDSTRLTTYTSCINCFSDTSGTFTTGWYRFMNTGTRLATTPPSYGSCGVSYPAWYNGTFPSTAGSSVTGTVCVQWSGNLCHSSYITTISVTNCNGYYVFYLIPMTTTGRRITSWDTSDPPKSLDSSQLMRNAPSLSMSQHNSLVPYSQYNAQVRSQNSIDQRQMQQIQYQTKLSRSSKPNSTDIETGTSYCSTNTPGWWNGTHPSTIGATTSGTLCVSYSGYLCNPSYSISPILATNCSGYYAYYLQTLSCYCCWIYPRYCTI
ncbi:unnamed protein product [Rotaria sordida]|uniref:Uncharacterized protein n=1 Tax=Rotaria sordida TaxID=392033 RepID=A0A819UFM8_9BILA|nr:unnamed protein product [Rotaria sordida]